MLAASYKPINPFQATCLSLLSIPLKNITKTRDFLMFSGDIDREKWYEFVKCSLFTTKIIHFFEWYEVNKMDSNKFKNEFEYLILTH